MQNRVLRVERLMGHLSPSCIARAKANTLTLDQTLNIVRFSRPDGPLWASAAKAVTFFGYHFSVGAS